MTPSLLSHKKWEFSKKMWYGKYHICVEFMPAARYSIKSVIPTGIEIDGSYRERQRYTPNGIIISIYTDDDQFAEAIVHANPKRVSKIKTPLCEDHKHVLSDTSDIVETRDKLYFGKYRYKIHSLKNYSHGFDRNAWNKRCIEANKWIKENFNDTRFKSNTPFNSYFFFGVEYHDVDYIYTNDEPTMMLYKLAFQDNFHITIYRAVTPADFVSV